VDGGKGGVGVEREEGDLRGGGEGEEGDLWGGGEEVVSEAWGKEWGVGGGEDEVEEGEEGEGLKHGCFGDWGRKLVMGIVVGR